MIRKNVIPILLLLCCINIACNSSKKAATANKTPDLVAKGGGDNTVLSPKENFFAGLDNNYRSPNWFVGKANISVEVQGNAVSLNGTILLRKDSAMLLILKKFGIEAVRALVTKDSVRVINRISGEYMIHPLSYLTETFNIPADFKVLQDVIIGNPPFLDKKVATYTQKDSTCTLTNVTKDLNSEYFFEAQSYNLRTVKLKQMETQNTLLLKYSSYHDVNSKPWSYTRFIEANDLETGRSVAQIDFTEIELNVPKTLRCEIPQRYKRVDTFEF
jgi:hypothetical protein